jgi:hypothetical protein
MNEEIKTTSKLLYDASEKRTHNSRSDLNLRIEVLKVMEILPWASKRHIQLWIRGVPADGVVPKRDSGIEVAIKALEDEVKLKSETYRKGRPDKAYTRRRKINIEEIPSYLENAECLVRYKVASPGAVVKSENDFKRLALGAVPEGAFLHPNGTLVLLEYSTENDWNKTRRLMKKIVAYRKCLEKIREAYGAKTACVLFIVDVDRERIARFADEFSTKATENDLFYFTDYETFKRVEMGQTRNAEIYYFVDGKEYSLC